MISRAYSTAIPLVCRAATSSPRSAYHISSSSVVQNRSVYYPRIGAPFARFSSKPRPDDEDDSILQILESEIQCADQPDHKILQHKPTWFPFEIEDNPTGRTILLTRDYGDDEIIKVEVDIPTFGDEDEEAEDDGGDHSKQGDNDEEENDNSTRSIPMVVSISKGKGTHLEFGITAYANDVIIDSLSIKHSEDPDDQIAYEPDFQDLDTDLHMALYKYLDVRGINKKTSAFLLDYMTNKEMEEYLVWLKNLENFFIKK